MYHEMVKMEKPRLLWVIPTLEIGGSERQLALLAPHISARFDCSVTTLFRGGPLEEEFREAGIEVHNLAGRSLYDRSLGSGLRALYRELRPAVVQSFLWDANVWTARALRKEADLCLFTARREIGGWRARRHLWAERWSNRFARRIVVNSGAAANHLYNSEKVRPEQVKIIYNAVDLERFGQVERGVARRSLGLAPSLLLLGVVGSLAEKKGHRHLLQALAACAEQLPPFELLVIGEGRERARLEELAGTLGLEERVRFLGVRADVPLLLSALDILLHPSTTESLPNAVLEGMASRLPVVATKVGGTGELIENDRVGCLVDTRAVGQWAEGIVQLAASREQRARMGSAARELASKRFRIEIAVDAYCRLYEEALES